MGKHGLLGAFLHYHAVGVNGTAKVTYDSACTFTYIYAYSGPI